MSPPVPYQAASKFLSVLVVVCMLFVATAAGPIDRLQESTSKLSAEAAPAASKYPTLGLSVDGSNSLPEVATIAAALSAKVEAKAPARRGLFNVGNAYALGLSSGGFLATQLQVAFSSLYSGAAIFAAGPYYCAQGSLITALFACTATYTPIDLPALETTTRSFATAGKIDAVSNLKNQPVYLYHGQNDNVVPATVNNALNQMYKDFGANVVYNTGSLAGHAWVSPLGPGACNVSAPPFINNCNNDDVENKFLTHLFQKKPNKRSLFPLGITYQFSQDLFSRALFNGANASAYSMDKTGFVYVPLTCLLGAKCAIHVVLHGCLQGYQFVGDQLVKDSNLNAYADTNNYIVLYPQAIATPDAPVYNPQGCWDWWGFTTPGDLSLYATHGAPQMEIINSVVRALGFNGKEK